MDLKETDILGDSISEHWYYQSKAAAMTKLIEGFRANKVLDVGAGSGFFSKFLMENTPTSECWCVDISYEEESDIRLSGKPLHFRKSIEKLDVDLVLMMDVLEHVDDDVALLKQYVDKVPAGTLFLISVPAFNFLWSGHDIFLDHKRRYTLKKLASTSKNSGLDLVNTNYYFFFAFPIAGLIRIFKKLFRPKLLPSSELRQHSSLVNGFMRALSHLELAFIRKNKLAGLTVFCLAKKE